MALPDAPDPATRMPRFKVRIFSSPSEAERARRATDAVLLGVGALGLGLSGLITEHADAAQASITSLIQSFPQALDGLWQVGADVPLVWAFVLVVIAVVARRRSGLVRDQLLAALLAAVVSVLLYRVAEGAWPALDWALANGPPTAYPAGRLAVAAAVIVTAAPHLSRPLRYTGRWILLIGALGAIFTLVATPGGTLGGFLVGVMAAATVHLVFGSPGGRPSLTDVSAALDDLGVEVVDLRAAELQPAGVWTVLGEGPAGEALEIKVYGRDAWDTQLVAQTWRFLWYRRSSARLRLSRERQVEHEAVLLLLARAASIDVSRVRAAGRARTGDTVLVLEPVAEPGRTGELDALWSALAAAHRAGVSPCAIDVTDLGWTAEGGGVLKGWGDGTTAPDEIQRLQDRAQLLIATMVLAEQDAAIVAARHSLGDEGTAELVPYLQVSTVPSAMRRRVDDLDDAIEALRDEVSSQLAIEQPELVQIRRVTAWSVIQMVLLVAVGSALISALSGLDFAAVADEVRDLAPALVLLCLVMGQVARASGAVSTMGASPVPLPLGPVMQLQFAIAYINLAVPSSVGRLAMMMRFFSRVGASAGAAVGVGAIDSAANFIVQIVLTVVILGFGLGTLDLSLSNLLSGGVDGDGGTLILLTIIGFVVAIIVVLAVPKLRRRVIPLVEQVREGLVVLHRPSKLAMVFGGDLLTQILYGVTLSVAVAATGNDVGIADTVLINTVVSLFAGLLPIPGGVGVSEAGLTAGLVAAGVPEPAAFSAALLHRLMTFYLPPIWGFFAMRSLRRERYL